jgi:hypothetical protein
LKAKKSSPLNISASSPAESPADDSLLTDELEAAPPFELPPESPPLAFAPPPEPADREIPTPAAKALGGESLLELRVPNDDNLPRAPRTESTAVEAPVTMTTSVDLARPKAWPVYTAATVVSALWALAPIMFAWGYRREVVPFQNDLFAMTVFALLALGPVALVWLAAYLLNQGLWLAAEMRHAQALADTMVQPAALAARGAGLAVENVRHEIERATAFAADARAELMALRDVIAAESERLVQSAQESHRTAQALSLSLGEEREKMSALAGSLDSQAAGVVEAINRHAKMVAEASDLAETQIREAEATLTARAADLAAAAGEVSDTTRVAGEDLTRQTARLETAGLAVGDQMRVVEEGMAQQRAALVTTAHGMRADQEAFAAEAESHLAQFNEIITQARDGTGDLGAQAVESAESLRQLIASAADNLRSLTQGALHEREMFGASAAQSLGAFSQVALAEREALERQTREVIEQLNAAGEEAGRAAAKQAELARNRVDQLSEAAFEAAQKAEAVFESRLNDARGLIAQSAQLVSEAGEQSNNKIGEGLEAARATLAELNGLLREIDERAAALPAEAHARAESVRQSLERGMDHLMASARKAAEETQTIDAAFQERVRRNYDMLSEAVRLMGVVAGTAQTPAARAATPRPPAAPRLEELKPAPRPAPTPPSPAIKPAAVDPWAEPAKTAEAAGLRPRLKLTPTASDEEFKTVFDAAGGREPAAEPGEDSWTWKELLSSMEPPTAAAPASAPASAPDDGAVALALLDDIDAMGIDAAALLPRGRIDQIALALREDGSEGGRALVHRLAPAALRLLSRRMMSDRAFQAQAERFMRRYVQFISEAISDGDAAMISSILGSDQGRAYLLIDAAASDAG